jgi:LysM repeat protein
MRMRALAGPVAVLVLLILPDHASAAFIHTVLPGESLSSVAATDGLTVSELAAENGLPPTTELITGSQLAIPPQGAGTTEAFTPVQEAAPAEATAAPAQATGAPAEAAASAGTQGDGDADVDDEAAAASGPTGAPSGQYLVQPGDTLTAIAERSGTTVEQLAAANGLDPEGTLLAGMSLAVGRSGQASPTATSPAVASSSSGQYLVQPGDTLTAIAERSGTTVEQLAAANGLDPEGTLLAGMTLAVGASGQVTPAVARESSPTSSSTSAATSQPVGEAATGSASAPPYPTAMTVTPEQIEAIANENGVPPSLANAIAWMESGDNNEFTSSANARGVMQITPGTWSWIDQQLAGSAPLAPESAVENVRGGVLLLHSLLESTGGNQSLAAAGYYQGLPSVLEHGAYPSTEQYVNDVRALQGRFGGE